MNRQNGSNSRSILKVNHQVEMVMSRIIADKKKDLVENLKLSKTSPQSGFRAYKYIF